MRDFSIDSENFVVLVFQGDVTIIRATDDEGDEGVDLPVSLLGELIQLLCDVEDELNDEQLLEVADSPGQGKA